MTALAVVVFATPALAQQGRCAACAAQSDSAFAALDNARSLEIALEGLKLDSNDVALLGRASRAELVFGVLVAGKAVDEHLGRAVNYARRAVALSPDEAATHFWLAAALGRKALRLPFYSAVSVAAETYRETSRALALDSLHAGAQEIMGKLHSETRKLNWVVRMLAANLTGLKIAGAASWEKAEYHLKRSIALDSTLLIARVDLSQLYLRTGRRAEAVAIVEQIEKMPLRTPVDAWFQGEARKRLGWYP